jgi:hypothetical protein
MSASLPGAIVALLRIHAEDARGRGRGDLHEAIERDFARVHAVVIDQLQAVLDARAAVGDLGEIVFAEHLLIFEAERAMVGGDHLQMIVLQAVPQLRLMIFSRSGGVKTYFAPSKLGRSSSSMESSRYCGQVSANAGNAAVARLAHLVERVFRREVHDVDRRAGDLRHGDGAMHGFGLGARGRVSAW